MLELLCSMIETGKKNSWNQFALLLWQVVSYNVVVNVILWFVIQLGRVWADGSDTIDKVYMISVI